ncbi:MAG: hypothetical protein M3P12_00745 [Gemmatimonadota bacterium]|nr:hypothetical protein [Gemmatimonadota bacterium]
MRRFGDLLLGLGVVVGIGAIVGYELDIIPTLPPAVLKLVLYKLIFVGGLGLLVAGAFIRRLATRIDAADADSDAPRKGRTNDRVQHELPSPPASDVLRHQARVRDKPPSAL